MLLTKIRDWEMPAGPQRRQAFPVYLMLLLPAALGESRLPLLSWRLYTVPQHPLSMIHSALSLSCAHDLS